jgi:hypothetical protein
VLSHRHLGAVHVDRVVPVVLGDPAEQPPQRGDPLGADREGDALVVGGTGQRAGEAAGVGAHRHPARSPGPLRQGGQPAAQQVRRGRARSSVPSPRSAARVISVSAQVATCGRPTR